MLDKILNLLLKKIPGNYMKIILQIRWVKIRANQYFNTMYKITFDKGYENTNESDV